MNGFVRKGMKWFDSQGAEGGGNSIQEYTAANPYYPPQKKTFGVRISVSRQWRFVWSYRSEIRPHLTDSKTVPAV